MTVKINYSNKARDKFKSNIVLFTNDKFKLSELKKDLSDSEFNYISDLLKTNDLKIKLKSFNKLIKVILIN